MTDDSGEKAELKFENGKKELLGWRKNSSQFFEILRKKDIIRS